MTKKLIGQELLEQAMRSYVSDNLPQQGNLNLYGNTFPEFIKIYKPTQHIPYLYDFTKLEWIWEEAYYAGDDLALNPEDLSNVSEDVLPDLRLIFRQSFALMKSDHPLDEIVEFCRSEDTEDMHELSERGCHLMIYRPDLKVQIRSLSEEEFMFLSSLKDGKTIYETAVTISELFPNFNLQEAIKKHLTLESFTRFETS
jgi:hypothetical protein